MMALTARLKAVPLSKTGFQHPLKPWVPGSNGQGGSRRGEGLRPTLGGETAKDGAPAGLGWVEENRQRQRQERGGRGVSVPQPSGDQAPSGWGTRAVWAG